MKSVSPTRIVTQMAVFSALSYVLYLFVKLPLPFLFPSFLDLQFSDMPALLAGFMMGPQYGVGVIALRTLLKLPFSTTACVGELADFLIGTAFVLASSLYYRKHRTKKGAVISLLLGIAATTATAMLANYLILIPFYLQNFFGGNWEPLLGMMRVLFPAITQQTFYGYYIFLSVLPFNVLRGAICSLVTFLVYKQLEKLLDKMFPVQKKKNGGQDEWKDQVKEWKRTGAESLERTDEANPSDSLQEETEKQETNETENVPTL